MDRLENVKAALKESEWKSGAVCSGVLHWSAILHYSSFLHSVHRLQSKLLKHPVKIQLSLNFINVG